MQKVYTQNNNYAVSLESLKNNDSNTLKLFYQANYPKVEAYILKNSGSKDQAKDIFQEAFIAVWKNIKDGKFEARNNSAINGYLYSISKNKWIDYLRSKHYKKTVIASSITNFNNESFSDENDDDILKEKRLQVVMHAFKDLGDACKSLLKKFYFEKKSMHTIAEELQLDTASTRNKKYRCMQKLKSLAIETDI